VILLLVSAVAWAGFSHQAHLKLKLTCAHCHLTAASSTRVEDNNLPLKQACAGCHQEVTLKVPATSMLSRFSHRKHLEMGNLAPVIAAAIDRKTYLSDPGDIRRHLNNANPCAACHRGMEESTAVSKSALPQMADCLVCHAQIDPPFSCEFCHARDAPLKPASHTAGFLDTHHRKDAGLDRSTCAVCHGRKFICQGCH